MRGPLSERPAAAQTFLLLGGDRLTPPRKVDQLVELLAGEGRFLAAALHLDELPDPVITDSNPRRRLDPRLFQVEPLLDRRCPR